MDPIGVWVRRGGEWAVIHRCRRCGKLSSNRTAADDNPMKLMSVALRPLAQPPFPLEHIQKLTDLMAEAAVWVGMYDLFSRGSACGRRRRFRFLYGGVIPWDALWKAARSGKGNLALAKTGELLYNRVSCRKLEELPMKFISWNVNGLRPV